jgi:SET domain-containing protein
MKQKIEIRVSKISGKGVFAKEAIKKGDTICFMEGVEVSDAECVRRIKKGIERDEDFLQFDDEKFIDMKELNRCINHSCDPNSFLRGKNELVALKNIKKDEEITYDYSTTMWEDKDEVKKILGRESWVMKCKCKSKKCRKRIDQFFLLPKKLQKYYVESKMAQDYIIKKYDTFK